MWSEVVDTLRSNPVLRRALLAFSLLITWGTLTFHFTEGWSWLDSLYFTIATITTVGYGDITPVTPVGRMMAIALMVAGIGVASYVITSFVAVVFRGDIGMAIRESQLRKRLREVSNHMVVCGYGRTGSRVAKVLRNRYGFDVIIVEKDKQNYRKSILDGFPTVLGDASVEDVLLKAKVNEARGVVVTTGNDKTNVFITLLVKSINPNAWVTAAAESEDGMKMLKRAGADRVIFIYECAAEHVSKSAVASLSFKVTVRHTVDEILDVMWIIISNEGVIQYVEYYTPPLTAPIRREINICNIDQVVRFQKKLKEDPEKKKALERIYEVSNGVHSYGVVVHDDEERERIVQELKREGFLVGVDLTPREIVEMLLEEEKR